MRWITEWCRESCKRVTGKINRMTNIYSFSWEKKGGQYGLWYAVLKRLNSSQVRAGDTTAQARIKYWEDD